MSKHKFKPQKVQKNKFFKKSLKIIGTPGAKNNFWLIFVSSKKARKSKFDFKPNKKYLCTTKELLK